MPHIVASSYREFPTPREWGGFQFLWFAHPIKGGRESLVAVQYRGEPFLLQIKRRGESFVIKGDKVARIAPTSLLKRSLAAFCQVAHCQILHHNLSALDRRDHALKAQEFFKDIGYFIDNFPREREVWIEIGFGSGRHILYQAETNPHIQLIGIEIHRPSIEQLLKQIALRELKNILVVDYDARLFLEFVPSNLVGRIFLHFPVPWDKKPHRRVISKPFIGEVQRVLKPGGRLELRTDSPKYFRYSLDLMLEEESVDLEVRKNRELPITSKYEDRWLRFGKDIYDIVMINHTRSPEVTICSDFSFKRLRYSDKIVESFDNRPKVYKEFFIHLERLYRIDGRKILLRLSFGSFERPEHRYIVIGEEGASYFPSPPVPSRVNREAHQKIEELLHG
ncbi:MAG: tRNA (guanosine(46)-N7)-methyltransferase TrmB [Epsilonproteobacteria bacterium]|nr:tRNA (guanosine(46)-N7)-methyltransferase TrmB [Campylobacterota bacterium]NPA57290.1 tRNA (guanosine(46)-N7)-methyltransferase TrmB [Campylobacterota bacterium]